MRKERLVGVMGSMRGKVIDIEGNLSIGRNPENALQIEDLQVSRTHCVIEQSPAGTILRDLGSGNGTYIGAQRILEYRLSPGDIITVGTHEFLFERQEESEFVPVRQLSGIHTDTRGLRFEEGEKGRYEAQDVQSVYETMFHAPAKAITEKDLQEAQKRLHAIYTANQIISSEQNLAKLFERCMDQIFSLIPAHNGVIMLHDVDTGELTAEYITSGQTQQDIVISHSIVNRAFEKGEAVITYDAADDSRFGAGASIIAQNISSAMCVPLTSQDETLGVLYVDTRGTSNAFKTSDLELLVALAGPTAIAIRNAQYLQMIEKSYQDTLIVLARAVELRDHYTVGHTWRVTNFSIAIARELGWSEEKLDEVQMAGVLHDVGKIAVDDAILRKPARLTEEEFAKMKIHPERGAELLRDVSFLHPFIPYCLYHHERYDGNGYPYGLKGEEIPIEGRVMAVADTFDAMTSNRPYRKGLDAMIAIQEIEKNKGTQFDPVAADALIKAFREGKIERVMQDYYKSESNAIACPFCSTHVPLPEDAKDGNLFSCHVCHRSVRLRESNQAWFGELLPESGSSPLTPRHNTPST